MMRPNKIEGAARWPFLSRTSVTIDGNKFNAYFVSFGITAEHEGKGMPLMGTGYCSIDIHVDVNDNVNMPFSSLKAIFDMANIVTKEKIKDIKIEFWRDDSKQTLYAYILFKVGSAISTSAAKVRQITSLP